MAELYDWTCTAGVLSQEASTYQGKWCAGLLGLSAVLERRIPLEHDLKDQTITFTGWVKGKIAGAPKLRITVGSTNYDSATVAADDTWEKLTATATIADEVQPIYLRCISNHASQKSYFDGLYPSATNVRDLLPQSAAFVSVDRLLRRVGRDWQTLPNPLTLTDGYMRLPGHLSSSDYIRIVGTGVWPELQSDTDTIDLNPDQVNILAIRAGLRLMRMLKATEFRSDNDHWAGIEADLMREEATALARLSRPDEVKYSQMPSRSRAY